MEGFVESMRLAKVLLFVPVIVAAAAWYAVSAFVHHRVFRTRDAIAALRSAAVK
jgi:hypothetical protein